MRIEIETNNTINQKYHIVREKQCDGTISIVLKPKKRNCKACGKEFQSTGMEFLYWKTKQNDGIYGWFCKKHYIQANKLIKELQK